MHSLYNIGIAVYQLLIWVASPFNPKAKKFLKRRQEQKWPSLAGNKSSMWLWFHTASLGEFEQGKPVIELAKQAYPDHEILISFFSPSGYEVRKDDPIADLVCYLPMDTPSNAKQFLSLFDVRLACFIKYDFWLNYLEELQKRSIPTICISARFRRNQLFFKPWGRFYCQFLFLFDHILVQDIGSKELLASIGYSTAEVTGDSRFDRVWDSYSKAPEIDVIAKFKGEKRLLVLGSVWPEDVEVFLPVMAKLFELGLKIVIAPHEVDPDKVRRLATSFNQPFKLWSEIDCDESLHSYDLLIVDKIGHLSSIYRYGDLSYVGGAFRGTLHNVLEPAVYGNPVLIGRHPKNAKFKEAVDLTQRGGISEITSSEELYSEVHLLLTDQEIYGQRSKICQEYVKTNRGASQKILNMISNLIQNSK